MRDSKQSVPRHQSGIALVAVLVFLLVIAAAVALKGGEELGEIHLAAADAEVRRLDYAAQAGLQHALWQARNAACTGDFTIAATQIGPDSYTATATGGGAGTLYTLSADQDAWIRSDNLTDNKGTDSNLHIQFDGSTKFEHPLYRFDLSALPAGARINSAVAWFYVSGEHPEGPLTVHRVTTDWTEADATWGSVGDKYETQTLATIPAQPDKDVWVSVNLAAQVQAWVNGQPNQGIVLTTAAAGVHGQYVSREGAVAEQPHLEVVVGTGAPSPLNIQATGTLANGKTLQLSRPVASAYQPPNIYAVQPGPTDGIDAYIWEANKSTNYGNDDEVWVSEDTNSASRSLFRFNMGAIPAGSRIVNATLSLQHESGNNTNVPVTAHRINQSWDEAAVTWNWADNDNNWNTQGGDLDATVFDTVLVGPAHDRYEWDIAQLVQGWVDGVYPNYGIALATAQDGSIGERFFSSDVANEAQRPSLTITYLCECGSACLAPQGKGTILMAVVDPTTLVPADELKKALFESWGYTVEGISESANQGAYDAAMAGSDVVFISETVNATQLGTKLQNAPIGVVSQDGSYNDDLGFASGSAWQVDSAIEIADTDHYITRPFAAGPLDIYAASMEMLTVSGSAAPDARLLVTAGGAGALVTLDAGAMGSGGTPVPARRVMLPLGRDNQLNWDYLSGNGLLLVQRAIAWAMGADDTSIGSVLLVVGDPASLTAQEDAKKLLMESWNFAVNLIDESDSQANFDAAILANDVAYIPQEINSTNLGTKLVNATIGVVNEEGEQVDELGFANGVLFKSRDEIDVIDNSHYITETFATGLLTISSSLQSVHIMDGGAAPGLQVLGETFNTGSQWKQSLATLDPGDELSGGGSAAGRRVELPWGGGTFDINQLTDDGRTIMRRALEWGAQEFVPQTVLMVVADPSALTAAETETKALIESWTYTVELLDDDDTQANFDAAASLADVAFISSDTDDTALGTKLTVATIGVVIEEQKTWRNLELCIDSAQLSVVVDIDITDNSHYITAPFPTGPLTILTSGGDTIYCSVTPSAGLVPLITGAGNPGLLTLDTGELRLDGQPSTGRRVTTAWGGNWDPTKLNSDGQTILRRSIEWAAGGAGGAPPPAQTVLLVSGNAASPPVKDTGIETLLTGWGFTVDWIDDGDSQANFDTQMAAADVVYVSGTVSGPSLLDKVTGVNKGVVNEINGKLDNFGFSSSTSSTATTDRFTKSDPLHYITEPFSGNFVTIFTGTLSMPIPGGTLAPDLQNVGEVSAAPALAALAAGATRWDGNPAPARRVHLPFTNADSSQLTADGETIMERAVRWAAGEGGDTGSGGGGGPTGVVFEEFTERKYGSTAFVENDKPPGTTEGDLLIATVATDGSTAGSMVPPAGWTMIDLANQSGAVTYGVWWKLAGASEPATYTFSWSGSEHAYGTIMRFTGHDAADPIDVSAVVGGSSSAPTSPAVTTTVADTMILRLGGFDDDDITTDAPGLTGHTAITMDDSGNGPATTSSGAGYVLQAAAGSSGTSSFALTNTEQYRTVTIAIAPAP